MPEQRNQGENTTILPSLTAHKRIIFRKDGQIVGQTDLLKSSELRMRLRDHLDDDPTKTDVDITKLVPTTTEEMTYEHALMLAGVENPESYKLKVVEGSTVQLEHLVEEDFREGAGEIIIDLLQPEFRVDAVTLIDMHGDSGEIKVPYAKGEELSKLLAQHGLQPNPRTVKKGMTYRDAINIMGKMKKADLTTNSFTNYLTKKPVSLDDFIPEADALAEGVTLIAANPIEGNA